MSDLAHHFDTEKARPKPKPVKAAKKRRGGLLITSADKAFSDCVRERANWTCERCGTHYEPPTSALHCHHFKGRSHWSIRYYPPNALCLCYGCHRFIHSNPDEAERLVKEHHGEEIYNLILQLSDNRDLAKRARREQKEIAEHYRNELSTMRGFRADGCTAWIAIDDYFWKDTLLFVEQKVEAA